MARTPITPPTKSGGATPFTKGKAAEGPKHPGGIFNNGTGGHTAKGASKGTIVSAPVKAPGRQLKSST